jgi:hypothetical protein
VPVISVRDPCRNVASRTVLPEQPEIFWLLLVAQLQRNKPADGLVENMCKQIESAQFFSRGNEPHKILLNGVGAIIRRRHREPVRVRVKTADNAPLRTAQTPQQLKMRLRIDQKMIRGVLGEIFCRMNCVDVPGTSSGNAFYQTAAF